MFKEKVIKELKNMVIIAEMGSYPSAYIDGLERAIDIVKSTRHKKVEIPKFVADIIESYKESGRDIHRLYDLTNSEEYNNWLFSKKHCSDRLELVARAWLDGYEIEQARLYMIEITGILPGKNILNYDKDGNIYFFESQTETKNCQTKFTQKELEDAGFGWLFEQGFAKEVEK